MPQLLRHPAQVLYAARDALVTLHCYRRLRLRHHTQTSAAASGKPCQVLLTGLFRLLSGPRWCAAHHHHCCGNHMLQQTVYNLPNCT